MIHKTDWTNDVSIVDAPNLNRIEGNIQELEDNINSLNIETAWTLIPHKSGFHSTAYCKKINNIVYFKGMIYKSPEATIPNGTDLATIPTAFRPTGSNAIMLCGGSAVTSNKVAFRADNGIINLMASSATTTHILLDGKYYFVD